MSIHSINRRLWQRLTGWAGLTSALLMLGGCVTCFDGRVGNVCYAPAPDQYGVGYIAPQPPQYQASNYAPVYSGAQIPLAPQPSAPQFVGRIDDGPMPGLRPGHEPGVGVSYPLSSNASNIGPYDTSSTIAPTLPPPGIVANATSRDYLITARGALLAGRTGQAQEAMEQAQTRLLDRSTPLFQTDRPSADMAVARISDALHALGAGDRAMALGILDTTIPMMN